MVSTQIGKFIFSPRRTPPVRAVWKDAKFFVYLPVANAQIFALLTEKVAKGFEKFAKANFLGEKQSLKDFARDGFYAHTGRLVRKTDWNSSQTRIESLLPMEIECLNPTSLRPVVDFRWLNGVPIAEGLME